MGDVKLSQEESLKFTAMAVLSVLPDLANMAVMPN
jgi:hypothetical protein